jgi:CsoR family transcriptional regulator, copper-sensing transcriptional repressor
MAYRPKDTQERILHRFKISLGHLKKVMSMVENDNYCIDIIHQSQAVQKALRETDQLILENHLITCATEAFKTGKSDKAVEELVTVFRKTG